ncbi:triadin [Grus japonensis]|uniref:Triadin n=1 Tax=Grus japonensis TaxID=30415 RepID=A0ABC9WDW5_GRUJA
MGEYEALSTQRRGEGQEALDTSNVVNERHKDLESNVVALKAQKLPKEIPYKSNVDRGIEHALSKFASDTKLCGAVNTLEGTDAIWRDLERWARASYMKFNKAECKVLHMGWAIPSTTAGWAENGLRAALRRRTWGCWLMRSST